MTIIWLWWWRWWWWWWWHYLRFLFPSSHFPSPKSGANIPSVSLLSASAVTTCRQRRRRRRRYDSDDDDIISNSPSHFPTSRLRNRVPTFQVEVCACTALFSRLLLYFVYNLTSLAARQNWTHSTFLLFVFFLISIFVFSFYWLVWLGIPLHALAWRCCDWSISPSKEPWQRANLYRSK